MLKPLKKPTDLHGYARIVIVLFGLLLVFNASKEINSGLINLGNEQVIFDFGTKQDVKQPGLYPHSIIYLAQDPFRFWAIVGVQMIVGIGVMVLGFLGNGKIGFDGD